jgi:disulfide bond formation protein DsbB
MTANAEWVVPATKKERRFAVFDVSPRYIGHAEYFRALHAEMNDGGLAAMLYDLRQMNLGEWHPRHVLQTDALQQQKSFWKFLGIMVIVIFVIYIIAIIAFIIFGAGVAGAFSGVHSPAFTSPAP